MQQEAVANKIILNTRNARLNYMINMQNMLTYHSLPSPGIARLRATLNGKMVEHVEKV